MTGLDPAAAMLERGKKKPHGHKIKWIQATAQDFTSEKRFDLVIMTGHAFQTLQDDVDVVAALKNVRQHLKPGGRFVFESRNPNIDWKAQWDYDMDVTLPSGAVHESRRFIFMQDSLMTFDLLYTFPDETLTSRSILRFATHTEIKNMLEAVGLQIEKTEGDWDGQAFNESHSPEMIFTAVPADRTVF
ncbi:MAG: methyltransferase domain-containing protein [Alphaproteobacteria bacterium]|nr:methyltransferase domain-containing protein [Alphaproteobacteria bacterium]